MTLEDMECSVDFFKNKTFMVSTSLYVEYMEIIWISVLMLLTWTIKMYFSDNGNIAEIILDKIFLQKWEFLPWRYSSKLK